MIKFTETLESDLPQIEEWISADEDHRGKMSAEWWLTGAASFLSFCIQDDIGPVFYARLDYEDDLIRMNIQFAPYSEVSKRRIMEAVLEGFPKVEALIKTEAKGMVFESTAPLLIRFFTKFGFRLHENNDYVLRFKES